MNERLAALLARNPPGPTRTVLEAVGPPADASAVGGSAYGLDPSGDFDLASLTLEHVTAIQQQLNDEPDAVLASARQLWDADLSADELAAALEKARVFIEQPVTAADTLESVQAFERAVHMPPGFGFEGYDPERLPIAPMDTTFETLADGPAYAATFVAAKVANAFKPKPRFPDHKTEGPFVYDYEKRKSTVGILADSGNGLAHSRYITKHLRSARLDHLVYLGDVYYTGTSGEFERFVAPEVEPFLSGDVAGARKVAVWMLNSNHEMFSKGFSYFSYLRYRLAKGAPQRQQGSYFAIRFGDAVQIIAIDTDYYGYRKFRDPTQTAWLRQRLAEGRQNGAINVLMSANEPFQYGSNTMTPLFDDLKPFLPSVDLWLWGNTHYCGLFDATADLPVSSCLGHGGYPYRLREYGLDRNLYQAPCPATPLFLETRSRYDGTGMRPELGNNGYAIMTVEPTEGRLTLDYVDWMKRPRYRAVLERRAGRVAVIHGQEF
jgi:hypothetical protein